MTCACRKVLTVLRGTMSTSETVSCLPYFTRGEVVTGFGRGSRQLGIPTGERDLEHLQVMHT